MIYKQPVHTLMGFIQLVFLGVVTLFPPVNPLGMSLIVDPMLGRLRGKGRKTASLKISFYCLIICLVSTLLGSWLLRLFGISLPVVQLAGGILISRMGVKLLSSNEGEGSVKGIQESSAPEDPEAKVSDLLFYPIAFPMTTGAGTISVLLTLSSRANPENFESYLLYTSALLVSILIICVLIFLCYAYTHSFIERLGPRGAQIVNRLSAFLVFCVGLQIASEGVTKLYLDIQAK